MLIVSMVFAVVTVFAVVKWKGGENWGKPVAGVCAGLTIAAAFLHVVLAAVNPPEKSAKERRMNSERAYAIAHVGYVGSYIKESLPGSGPALVIHGRVGAYNREIHDAQLKALQDSMGETVKATESVDSVYWEAKDFDSVLAANSDCKLVISLAGLPADFEDMAFWEMEDGKRPKLIVFQNGLLSLRQAIEQGFVSALVVPNPEFKHDLRAYKPPSGQAELFKERYLLYDAKSF
jgi:hypothetical protein